MDFTGQLSPKYSILSEAGSPLQLSADLPPVRHRNWVRVSTLQSTVISYYLSWLLTQSAENAVLFLSSFHDFISFPGLF